MRIHAQNDAVDFKPMRGLESHDDTESLSKMEANWISFGASSRARLERNVASLKVRKVVPRAGYGS